MTRYQTGSQTVVVVAMGLVAAAAAVALHQHAGLPVPVAATAALSAYLLLLTVHALIWRRERRALEPALSRDRREQEIRRMQEEARHAPILGRTTAGLPAPGARTPAPPQPPAPQPPRAAAPPPYAEALARGLLDSAAAETPPPVPPPVPPAPPRAAERATPPPLPASPSAPPAPPAGAPMNEMQDYWSFRPAAPELNLPPFVTGRVSGRAVEPTLPEPALPRTGAPATAATPPPLPPAPPRAAAPREADVEVIQDAIKRLLEEVNAAEQQEGRQRSAATPPPLPSGAAPAASAGTSVEQAIEALRMTAGTMRTALGGSEAPPREAAPAAAPPQPPFVWSANPPRPMSPADARARLMADAISAGRIDVSLEPILGLEDQQTRHYEVSVRLRDADGNPLELTPDGPDLRGTGLLPLFDGVRVTRTAAVARRLEERGKGGSVFSAFSGESVADEHFLGELAETLHQRSGLAAQLVLSFTQSDVRGFSTPEWDSLADMRSLGFRFALSAITDLDMDFEALAEQGFAFVKLDAAVFLEGLPAPSGHLPSSDVCRHLAKHGLTLVVEHIDDDEKLARVFGFGVLLGQGQLFGGPRPVRADVVSGRGRTAAA